MHVFLLPNGVRQQIGVVRVEQGVDEVEYSRCESLGVCIPPSILGYSSVVKP